MRKYDLLLYIKTHFYVLAIVLLLFTMPVRSAMNCQLANSPGGCQLLVQATILNRCQISDLSLPTLGELNFGSYASIAKQTVVSSLNLNSLVSLDCTPNIHFTITVDNGLNYDGQRNMKNSNGQLIPYQLFSDSALTQNIIANQPITVITPENGNNILLPIYSKSQLAGTHAPGLYTDKLIINISW